MATYSIKAPNGKTYDIDGPAGASQSDVQAEVLRQHPEAGEHLGVGEAVHDVVRGAGNIIPSGAELLKGVMMSPIAAAKAVGTEEGRAGLKATAENVGAIARGGIQRVRELSPKEFRGNAPENNSPRDTAAYDAFKRQVGQNFGTTLGNAPNRILNTVANDPAMFATLAVNPRSAVEGIGKVTKAIPKVKVPVPAAVTRYTQAGPRGKAAAATMSGEAEGAFTNAGTRAEAARVAAEGTADTTAIQATRRAERAAKAERIAELQRRREAALKVRQGRVQTGATPPPVAVGTPTHLDDLGMGVREPSLRRQAEIEATMKGEYAAHEAATKTIAKDLADRNIGASDGPKAQALIAEVRDQIEPNRYSRKPVSNVLDKTKEGAAHNRVLARLTDERHDLATPKEVAEAKAHGHKVLKDADGQYFITKPNLEAVENLHRELGDKAYGREVAGFENVSQKHAQKLYAQVNEVLDEYTAGAHSGMRDAWREGKERLLLHEKTKAGQALVGVQKGTPVSSVAPGLIPGRIINNGREGLAQAAAVAGEEPVKQMLRSYTQHKLTGLDTAAKVKAAIAEGTKLGEAIRFDPALASDVQHHIAQLLNAEAHGARATQLGGMAATAADRAKRLDAVARQLTGEAASLGTDVAKTSKAAVTAAKRARDYERRLDNLKNVKPEEVGPLYQQMLKERHDAGEISTTKYEQGMKLSRTAEQAFKDKAARNKAIKEMGYAAGLGGAGLFAGGPLGAVAGVGLSVARPHVWKALRGGRKH